MKLLYPIVSVLVLAIVWWAVDDDLRMDRKVEAWVQRVNFEEDREDEVLLQRREAALRRRALGDAWDDRLEAAKRMRRSDIQPARPMTP